MATFTPKDIETAKSLLDDSASKLSQVFKNIQKDAMEIFEGLDSGTNEFTAGLFQAGKTIKDLKTPAEQYLGIQKLQETIQSKINELKSKSSYLDNTALAFKSEELDLQQKITKAQMAAIEISKDFMPAEKSAALNVLKIKMITSKA